jgi:hypothetical protein
LRRLFAAGRNAKQVQRFFGHHSPAFTMERYVHLLDDGVGAALDLAVELPGGNEVATDGAAPSGTQPDSIPALVPDPGVNPDSAALSGTA